ncbi:hypothetical protein B6N60_00927 [Richelia sinica FACHB-800]|uniref:Sporulation/spore germination protein n=1 Tax=Richelia sinica FACHB-800 TaxID=1357546 RepID=A0A975Y3L2_9NOST|nr:GerMN domain-containing protein [Richelia sinica]MBD2664359.1 GerMN domain-containing protein [Richelia sinica FACHB-800]QXE22245.1 hypothetical protein B6N60_00927 [Richelia sinica FACHB-800]
MYTHKKYLFPLALVVICTILSSCTGTNTGENANNPSLESPTTTTTPRPQLSPSTAQLRSKSVEAKPNTTQEQPDSENETKTEAETKSNQPKTINVTLYTSDDQCQELIPKKTEVSAQEPVTEAIGQILKDRDGADFSLSGYRVNIKDGVATVDLRLAADSKRQLASLSSCEQFAIFSSLRKTLTSNAQWNIKDVRFTERGQDLAL